MERGTVRMRVAFVLRSAEVQPPFRDLCDGICIHARPRDRTPDLQPARIPPPLLSPTPPFLQSLSPPPATPNYTARESPCPYPTSTTNNQPESSLLHELHPINPPRPPLQSQIFPPHIQSPGYHSQQSHSDTPSNSGQKANKHSGPKYRTKPTNHSLYN